MKNIRFITWNKSSSQEQVALLKQVGYLVDSEQIDGPESLRKLRQNTYDLFLIDLSKSPAQGRDIAIHLRRDARLRQIPLVFLGGMSEKKQSIQQLLPDAVYLEWDELTKQLDELFNLRNTEPFVPDTVFAAFRDVPLSQKLGLKANSKVLVLAPPMGFTTQFESIPNLSFTDSPQHDIGLILWFIHSRQELQDRLREVFPLVGKPQLWMIWRKKTAYPFSDLTQEVIRKIGLDNGLVDYKICALDKEWTGLKFSRRKSQ